MAVEATVTGSNQATVEKANGGGGGGEVQKLQPTDHHANNGRCDHRPAPEEELAAAAAPHVLILPYAAQGHINPMLQFAKRLVSKGAQATIAIVRSIARSMHADPNSAIHVVTISDGFDDGGIAHAESVDAYLQSFKAEGMKTLSEVIKKLKENGRPIHAVVYDGFLPWGLDIAKQFGVMGAIFFTQTCAVNAVYYHVHKGVLKMPFTKDQKYCLPCLPPLDFDDIPTFVSNREQYPGFTDMILSQFDNIDDCDWVFFSNFYELEKELVDWMSKLWKKLATVGPTVPSMFLDKRVETDTEYGINLFKPDTGISLTWLKDKPTGSVVYVSFGSMAELDEEQMAELAWGVKASGRHFLWVVRASEEPKLPQEFKAQLGDNKGLIVNWCRQLEVLSHEAIGCFVTHGGLSSCFEAISLGVPLVAVPQWTDQQTNAKCMQDIWRVGIRTQVDEKGYVRRDNIEKCIREVMEGEKGKELRMNAEKWKRLALDAASEGGSSDRNINEFVAQLKSAAGLASH